MEDKSIVSIKGFKVKLFKLGGLEVGIAIDVGPRILYLGLVGRGENILEVDPETGMETPDGYWRLIGGHRLWIAPEEYPRTYSIDDKPVKISIEENSIVVEGQPERENNVLKRIKITPGATSNSLRVIHEVVNIGRWEVKYAPWAITVVKPGGVAIIPVKPLKRDKHGLQADRVISLWPYTTLSDPRLKFIDNYILVHQDLGNYNPLKIGASANPPIIAYYIDKYLFIKKTVFEQGEYPDLGSSVEVYVSSKYLELETLAPLKLVKPGGIHVHVEEWILIEVGRIELTTSVLDSILNEICG